MAQAQDFTKIMQDMMGALPMDTTAVRDSINSQAAFGEKLSKLALQAANSSTEVASKWAQDTIAQTDKASVTQQDPAGYAKSLSDFASAQAELVSENLTAFADIAKKAQLETVELVMAAGKDLSEDAGAVVNKATKMASKTK